MKNKNSKIKYFFITTWSLLLSFISTNKIFADIRTTPQPLYGIPEPDPKETIFRILSSIFFPIIILFAIIVGIVILIRRKRKKNAKKTKK